MADCINSNRSPKLKVARVQLSSFGSRFFEPTVSYYVIQDHDALCMNREFLTFSC